MLLKKNIMSAAAFFDKAALATLALASAAVVYVAFSDDDGGDGEDGEDGYGVCGNIKFVTNTFKDMPTSDEICKKLDREDGCLRSAQLKRWGPRCEDIEFSQTGGVLHASGGCRKFAEKRGDREYYPCVPDTSKTCKASVDRCAVRDAAQFDDAPYKLLPCPPMQNGADFPADARGVDECANVRLTAGATCGDYVARPDALSGVSSDGILDRDQRVKVQMWQRCVADETDSDRDCRTMVLQGETQHCARLKDLP